MKNCVNITAYSLKAAALSQLVVKLIVSLLSANDDSSSNDCYKYDDPNYDNDNNQCSSFQRWGFLIKCSSSKSDLASFVVHLHVKVFEEQWHAYLKDTFINSADLCEKIVHHKAASWGVLKEVILRVQVQIEWSNVNSEIEWQRGTSCIRPVEHLIWSLFLEKNVSVCSAIVQSFCDCINMASNEILCGK